PRNIRPNLITMMGVVAALYFGRDFFLPLALAILLVFLLTPIAQKLESLGLGRVGSVIATTLAGFTLCGLLAWMLAGQVLDLANKLPDYQNNLHAKIVALSP